MTDFNAWLDNFGPHSNAEVLELHDVIFNLDSGTSYSAEEDATRGTIFVRPAGEGRTLALVSDDARRAFISLIEKRYCRGLTPRGITTPL